MLLVIAIAGGYGLHRDAAGALADERGKVLRLLDEQRPRLEADFRVERPATGPTRLRISITNSGLEAAPPPLLNLLFPASWTIFRPCNENGQEIRLGSIIPSDEDLPDDAGGRAKARLWTHTATGPIEGHVTAVWYFELGGIPAGAYPLSLRIPPEYRIDPTVHLGDPVP